LLENISQYRRLIGKLIYLTVTKPGIDYIVGLVSQFMHKSREIHWKTALRILIYIKRSPSKGMLYKKHGHLRVQAFSYSNYAKDKSGTKSTSDYCTFVGGNLVP